MGRSKINKAMKKDTLGAQRLRKWDLDREDKYGTTNTLSAKQFKEADIVLGLLTVFFAVIIVGALLALGLK